MSEFTHNAAMTALSILRSRKFFFFIVGFLTLQAAWIALVAQYPMAFDEGYHFGLIQLYASQWTPFIDSAPPGSGPLGDVVRYPSYLYHYLMSFPHRLVALFTEQEMLQIIALRFINIALFVGGLVAFRKVLQALRFSSAITNFSLLMITLIPVVPFLAGQINYDNLLFLLTPLIVLFTLRCAQSIRKNTALPPVHFTAFLATGMLASLVKYAFLPIFLTALIYLAVIAIRQKNWRTILDRTTASLHKTATPIKIMTLAGLILSSGLFIERYGINAVQYHSLRPDCAAVQTTEHCSQYGPWARNAMIAESNAAAGHVPYDPEPQLFLQEWIDGMMHRLYFAINHDYVNYYELPIPIAVAYGVGTVGLLLCLIFSRSLFKDQGRLLIAGIIVVYTASLLYINLSLYLNLKTMLAINGRYLILVLPFVFALLATSYGMFARKITPPKHAAHYKLTFASIVLLFTLQGGGILTFAVRSDNDWYWQTPFSQELGSGLKGAALPFIFGADHKEQPKD